MNIREYLFTGMSGCTNHGCVITGPKEGMGTNGSCHCVVNMSRSQLEILQNRIQSIAKVDCMSSEQAQQRIDELEFCLTEWLTKTEWVQKSAPPKYLGMHRADVMNAMIQAAQEQE